MNFHHRRVLFAAVLSLLGLLVLPWRGQTERSPFLQERPSAADSAFEASQTAKLLGVPVRSFPAPQGLTGLDELPANALPFRFNLTTQSLSGKPPRVYFANRKIVTARAPDGSVYEAYCGNDDPTEIVPGHGFVSTFENRRQRYETHYGYGYMPQDVFIGKRERGRIRPTLFFRDVGSHTTAPHALAVDNRGMVFLAVADVNISQGNRLDLYWVIGDPKARKWNSAWLIDRRGFTTQSSPWSGGWSDKVHLIWDWCDQSIHKDAPNMGAFHVEWSLNRFGRKTRIFESPVQQLDAAIDQKSGLLVIVLVKDGGGVYVLSRTAEGTWTRPSLLHTSLKGLINVSIEGAGNGDFIVRTSDKIIDSSPEDTTEWLLRPLR